MRSSASRCGLAALGRADRAAPMPVASVADGWDEAHDADGSPRSGLEAVSGATRTRQNALRAREIMGSTV